MIVPDASVFVKLFLDEPDRDLAKALFQKGITGAEEIIAPSLLLYESLAVAQHYSVEFDQVMEILTALRDCGFHLVEPPSSALLRASAMSAKAHREGRLTLQDCIYHALAIELDGTFVTADARHARRAKSFGSVALLADFAL